MVKYVDISARKGVSGALFKGLQFCFAALNLEKLYYKAQNIMCSEKSETPYLIDYNAGIKNPVIMKRSDIEKTIDMNFEGNRVMVAAGYDHMLRQYYGNYMELPPEKERNPKHVLSKFEI